MIPRLFLAGALSLGAAGAAQAAKVDKVEIHGLDEAMTQNVRVSLSLVDSIGKEVSGRRLGYLLREAENETREALEPFGYYSPTITVVDSRGDRVSSPAPGADAPNAPGERDDAAGDAAAGDAA
ncbi:POTRA domain-containing protein, partial [Lysobacter enzymogenes]|uniref:POTRA domain-containing protein n=1 Tax=Lysobacter enzymogenes TaxID=69 RepID=UPI003D1897CA